MSEEKKTIGKPFSKENQPENKNSGPSPRVEIDDATLKNIETYGGLGLSWNNVAALLSCDVSTLRRHRKENPDIDLAYNSGKAKAAAKVAMAAYHRATVDRSDIMIRWWETTREGMSEKTEVTETSNQYVIQAPRQLTPEEWNEKFGNGAPSE